MDDKQEALTGGTNGDDSSQQQEMSSGMTAVQRQLAEYRQRMSTRRIPSPSVASTNQIENDPSQRLLPKMDTNQDGGGVTIDIGETNTSVSFQRNNT